jgi:hypothetical protein
MGELLKRGYDSQLADRNTKGYDILAVRDDQSPFKGCKQKLSEQHRSIRDKRLRKTKSLSTFCWDQKRKLTSNAFASSS